MGVGWLLPPLTETVTLAVCSLVIVWADGVTHIVAVAVPIEVTVTVTDWVAVV